jgi:hypothetical protein
MIKFGLEHNFFYFEETHVFSRCRVDEGKFVVSGCIGLVDDGHLLSEMSKLYYLPNFQKARIIKDGMLNI